MKKITNTNLLSIISYKFSITAISSILHRISGVILTILMPFTIICMNYTFMGPYFYNKIINILTSNWLSIFFWLFLSSITYHIYAGIRHIIIDIGFGENIKIAKFTSLLIIFISLLSSALWGYVLWL